MTRFTEDLRSLRLAPSSARADQDFVAQVMKACSLADEAERQQPWRHESSKTRPSWGYRLGLAVVAAAAVAVMLWPPQKPQIEAPATGSVAARGNGHAPLAATVQAFVGRAAAGAVPPLLEGALLHPGDGILVRYSNPTANSVFLMVFALDERGAVHWIHPAYLDDSTNPQSLLLSPHSTDRVLPEVAEPEDPAPGALHVYALLSPQPLAVKQVEATLAGSRRTVAELFPEAEVEQWTCSWSAQ